MIIGIDIDGTLTDYEKYVDEKMLEYFGKTPVNKNIYYDIDRYGITEEQDKEFWERYATDYTLNTQAREGAAEAIEDLAQKNQIIILTNRGWKRDGKTIDSEERKQTVEWLAKNNIPYHAIYFNFKENHKAEICKWLNIDIMFEDAPYQVEGILQAQEHGLRTVPIIVDCNFNRTHQSVKRIKQWNEAKSVIDEIWCDWRDKSLMRHGLY